MHSNGIEDTRPTDGATTPTGTTAPTGAAATTGTNAEVAANQGNAADTLFSVEDGATVDDTAKTKRRVAKTPNDPTKAYIVEDGAAIADESDGDVPDVSGIQRLYVRQGETAFIRFVTRQLVTLDIHFSIPDDEGGQTTLRCNGGKSCVLCQVKFKPTRYSLLPVFSTDEQALRVLQFGRQAGPGSLCVQVLRELKKPDYTGFVYQIEKGRSLFVLKVFTKIDDDGARDFGDDVLRDIIESGQIPEPSAVAASVASMPNDEIVETFERVARRLHQMGARK